MSTQIQLQTSSTLHVPFQSYQKDFSFIVNNKEFQTNRIIADLLSQKIAKLHQIDPTITEYSITTKYPGNFSTLLSLINFKPGEFKENEIPFLNEIFSELEISTEYVKINNSSTEYGQFSIFSKLQRYQQFPQLFGEEISKEIKEVASHLYNMKEEEKKILKNLSLDTIKSIFGHPSIQIASEDQLIEIINELYDKDRKYSQLYSFVCFTNVSTNGMKEFVSRIRQDDISREAWSSISERLCKEIKKEKEEETKTEANRYKEKRPKYLTEILYNKKEFDGIINYLRKQTDFQDEINISCSSHQSGDPQNLFNYEKKGTFCITNSSPNSWFCFEFKKHEIMPTNYTIRTQSGGSSCSVHLKSWIFEGSKDNMQWTTLDEENNNSSLNGSNFVHTFPIQNETQESFKYLRIRQTEPSWQSNNDYRLLINCIEFYGKLI